MIATGLSVQRCGDGSPASLGNQSRCTWLCQAYSNLTLGWANFNLAIAPSSRRFPAKYIVLSEIYGWTGASITVIQYTGHSPPM